MLDQLLSILSCWLYGDFSLGRNAAMREMLRRAEPVERGEMETAEETA